MLRVILTNDMDVAVDADFFKFENDEVRLVNDNAEVVAKFERKYVMGVYKAITMSCTMGNGEIKFEPSYPPPTHHI